MEYFDIFLALFFLLLNAFFVLAEFAIVKIRNTRIEELENKGVKLAKLVKEITTHLDEYLSTCQLGITIASLGLGWVGEPAFSFIIKPLLILTGIPMTQTLLNSFSIAISFSLITGLHVVIGELTPKNLAIRIPEKSAFWVAIPLKIFHNLMYVPMLILNESANFILKLLKLKSSETDMYHSEDEIRLILSHSEELGRISLQRLMMFEHLFDFGKTFVKEIMTPKEKIVTIDIGSSYEKFMKILSDHKFSRYPVKDGDKIIGFIHIKDIFLNCSLDIYKNMELKKFVREIKTISENLLAEKALRYFQENNIHISLVSNEKGEVVGLLSVEDIIEDITGEIRDEFEKRPVYRLDLIFDKKSSVMDVKSADRFEAIVELIEKSFENKIFLAKNEIKEKIIKREKSFSTAIGHQVAIPHARVEGLKKPVIVVGKSEGGINFPSPDNKPVKLIFMILTPYNDPSIQLNILSKISRLISNLTLRKKLLNAKNPEKVEEVLTIFEDNIPLD